jgi:hypothetical protein
VTELSPALISTFTFQTSALPSNRPNNSAADRQDNSSQQGAQQEEQYFVQVTGSAGHVCYFDLRMPTKVGPESDPSS